MSKLKILTPGVDNPKTAKVPEGFDRPVVNDLMHLAPAHTVRLWAEDDELWAMVRAYAERRGWLSQLDAFGRDRAKAINVCTSASEGCVKACLNKSGKGEMAGIYGLRLHLCRVARTLRYYSDRVGFMADLRSDIDTRLEECAKAGAVYVCRLNGTSDLPGLALLMAREYPQVTFYDYTKHPQPWARELPNYRLTFSRSETNTRECLLALANGINVAVAFMVKRGGKLPETFMGRPVIDGDLHDHRWLDPRDPKGFIVGLRVKGRQARNDTSGFIVPCNA